jgi:hypothetical protein
MKRISFEEYLARPNWHGNKMRQTRNPIKATESSTFNFTKPHVNVVETKQFKERRRRRKRFKNGSVSLCGSFSFIKPWTIYSQEEEKVSEMKADLETAKRRMHWKALKPRAWFSFHSILSYFVFSRIECEVNEEWRNIDRQFLQASGSLWDSIASSAILRISNVFSLDKCRLNHGLLPRASRRGFWRRHLDDLSLEYYGYM